MADENSESIDADKAKMIADAAPELLMACVNAINVYHQVDCPFGKAYSPKSECLCNYHEHYRETLRLVKRLK